jgi:hypothetical protein
MCNGILAHPFLKVEDLLKASYRDYKMLSVIGLLQSAINQFEGQYRLNIVKNRISTARAEIE